jgi:hypothetical protein
VFGSKKSRKEIKENLIDRPPTFVLRWFKRSKPTLCLAESVVATVEKRRSDQVNL